MSYCLAMSVALLPYPRAFQDDAAGSATRLASALLSAYLAATAWLLVRYAAASGELTPLLVHLGALGLALAVTASDRRAARVLRDWLPLLLGPLLYIELRWLIPGGGRPHLDPLVQQWELALFPGQPSATWAPRMPSVMLSEALHLAYASYYLLVYLPPLVLYLRGRREAFARTMLALTLVYACCFLTYLFFPVDGPRYLVGPAAAPEGPIRGLVLHLLAAGSSRGTAFPSSHIAASVVASLCAIQLQRPVGVVVALLTVGLALGTVYGGFHYAVDGIAGLLVGILAWSLAGAIWRRLSRRGEQRATAA
jgi:membrane-associated phospholipid phosphatase